MIAQAVKQFYEKHQCLPLPGKVPDMKAESKVYVRLQTIYKNKARKDAAEVLAAVQAMPGGNRIDPAEVSLFCKNAAFVKLINATPPGDNRLAKVVRTLLPLLLPSPSPSFCNPLFLLRLLLKYIEDELGNDENAEVLMTPLSLVPIYLVLQATANGSTGSAEAILAGVERLAPGASENERVAMIAQELARTGGGELHNISALMGGMVAQEMIKIITKQYVPIDNTCIFDGISSRCQVLCL